MYGTLMYGLAPIDALDGTRGRVIAQKANASCFKGVCTLKD